MFPPEDVTSRAQEELFNILGNNTNVSIYKLKDFKGKIPCVQLWNIAYPDTFINIILYSRLVIKTVLVFIVCDTIIHTIFSDLVVYIILNNFILKDTTPSCSVLILHKYFKIVNCLFILKYL